MHSIAICVLQSPQKISLYLIYVWYSLIGWDQNLKPKKLSLCHYSHTAVVLKMQGKDFGFIAELCVNKTMFSMVSILLLCEHSHQMKTQQLPTHFCFSSSCIFILKFLWRTSSLMACVSSFTDSLIRVSLFIRKNTQFECIFDIIKTFI